MTAKRRTRKEKERVRYHLEGTLLKSQQRWVEQDKKEFAYLEAKYIKKDLTKTVVYSLLMLGILWLAKWYLS